jgi:hypothetical protein
MSIKKITENLNRDEIIKELEILADAFTDVLDGENVYDIVNTTGLSEERAEEIYNLCGKYLAVKR